MYHRFRRPATFSHPLELPAHGRRRTLNSGFVCRGNREAGRHCTLISGFVCRGTLNPADRFSISCFLSAATAWTRQTDSVFPAFCLPRHAVHGRQIQLFLCFVCRINIKTPGASASGGHTGLRPAVRCRKKAEIYCCCASLCCHSSCESSSCNALFS